MSQPSVISCPKCGMQVSPGTVHCPVCQARIRPITPGRLIAWGVIVALIFVVALLWAIFARH
jgi:uncharacterized OB-fold protein